MEMSLEVMPTRSLQLLRFSISFFPSVHAQWCVFGARIWDLRVEVGMEASSGARSSSKEV